MGIMEKKMETTIFYRVIGWILGILHDPTYFIPWELEYYSIVRSCRILVSTVYKGYRDCRDNVVVWVLNRCIQGKGEKMKLVCLRCSGLGCEVYDL